MEFRAAVLQDLPKIKTVYKAIIEKMDREQMPIWDDVYPCEFFEEDIRNNRLYVLLDQDEIVSAFALCGTNTGEKSIEWQDNQGKDLYLERYAGYSRKGIGSFMVEKVKEAAKNAGASYLRLFVVDINELAIRLYRKNGFVEQTGVYGKEEKSKS